MLTESVTSTPEATTVPETQSEAPDNVENPDSARDTENAFSKGKAQAPKAPAKAASIDTPENAEALRLILRREKEDPNVKFSDKELDLYDAYTAGKLKPAKKPSPHKAASATATDKPGADMETEAEADEAKEEDSAEETDTPEDAAEESEEAEKPSKEAEAIMKELGAKDLADAVAKLKGLKSKLGGRDSKAVADLTRQVQNEKHLWEDVAKGVPAAIAHAERAYGIKLAGPGGTGVQATQAPAPVAKPAGERKYISEDAFIDPDSAKQVNDLLRERDAEIDELRSHSSEFKQEKERARREAAEQQGRLTTIDHMVQVAQRMPSVKGIANLRERIADFANGKNDPELVVFNELFDICAEKGTDLDGAWNIKRGREADKLIAEAEERGRKSAYGHKPNPSLSGQQGGKGETTYQNLTEDQIDAMSEDGGYKLMPDDWFNKDGAPIQNRVPKKAWRIFGFKG